MPAPSEAFVWFAGGLAVLLIAAALVVHFRARRNPKWEWFADLLRYAGEDGNQ